MLMGDAHCLALAPVLGPFRPRCPMWSLARPARWRLHREAPAAYGWWQSVAGALHCWDGLASAWGLQALSTSLML